MYVSIPDEQARAAIFKQNTAKSKHDLVEEDWMVLGKESEGFSG